MLVPAMEQNGYSRRFSAAITAASSVIGPIIPPSGIMIIYAFIMNVSVGGLFAAGLVPGFLVAAGLMFVTARIARKRDYPVAAARAGLARARNGLPANIPGPHDTRNPFGRYSAWGFYTDGGRGSSSFLCADHRAFLSSKR